MTTVRIPAPAKINLRLAITGRRADGYHTIATVFHKISLCDELTIRATPGGALRITSDDPNLPTDRSNIVHTAASLLAEELGCACEFAIHITKRIPVGAGLGGGSSDAAATLSGICRLLDLHPADIDLHRIGVRVGADVPFFLHPAPTASATGIGDILQPLPVRGSLWLIVVFPGVGVSTAWAYRTFSEYNLLTNIPDNIKVFDSIRDLMQFVPLLHNDFERVVFPAYPQVQAAKDMLQAAGASGTLMSGSGSAVFGIFSSMHARDTALRALPNTTGYRYFAAHSVL